MCYHKTAEIKLIEKIKSVLTEDLLKDKYKGYAHINPTHGHCYAATEALFYLLKETGISGYRPKRARDYNGVVHWWLENKVNILDPTEDQYRLVGDIPPYSTGIFGGFLTSTPSKRAKEIIRRVRCLDE